MRRAYYVDLPHMEIVGIDLVVYGNQLQIWTGSHGSEYVLFYLT